MIDRFRNMLALAGASLLAVQPALAADKQCLPTEHAEALFLLVAPTMMRTVGERCRAQRPDRSFRALDPALLAKYDAAAKTAQADGFKALEHFGAKDVKAEWMPMVVAEMGKEILSDEDLKRIGVNDCLAIDRMLTASETLPPATFVQLFISIASLAGGKGGGKPDICPITE